VRALKPVLKSDAVRRGLCWLGSLYIRLVFVTGRWRTINADIPETFWRDGRPFILCFWHGRILMMPKIWPRGRAIHMLISQHRDGQIIARTVAHFGIDTVAGSSSKGGTAALRSMLAALKRGECVGITPDGPRGPRMRASDGIVSLARMSGAAIVPATYSARPARALGSWDRFLVPAPFCRGVFIWGDPIVVDRDADAAAIERARLGVEESLNAITDEADRTLDRPRIDPAPLSDVETAS
jgi:lysophospholipid acyltransferase (LPLAT)-like uncharacterized protein